MGALIRSIICGCANPVIVLRKIANKFLISLLELLDVFLGKSETEFFLPCFAIPEIKLNTIDEIYLTIIKYVHLSVYP